MKKNVELSKENIGRLQIIVPMVVFGTIGIFVKAIGIPSAEVALYRGLIAFCILSLVMGVTGRFSGLKSVGKNFLVLLLSGVLMSFNWVTLFSAYNYTSIALSTLAYYFAPTIIVIVSSLLFKEKLSRKNVICFLGSTAGLVLIIGVSGGGSNDMIGILFGLSSAVLYATVVLINKRVTRVDSITKTWIQFLGVILVMTPFVGLTGGFHFMELSGIGLISMLTLGVFHTGIIYVIYFSGVEKLKGQQAAILSYIDPAVSVAVSVLILSEPIKTVQLIGGIMIVLFAMVNEISISIRRKKC